MWGFWKSYTLNPKPNSGFRALGRFHGKGSRVIDQGLAVRVQDFEVWGLGFRVWGPKGLPEINANIGRAK